MVWLIRTIWLIEEVSSSIHNHSVSRIGSNKGKEAVYFSLVWSIFLDSILALGSATFGSARGHKKAELFDVQQNIWQEIGDYPFE